MGGGIPYFDRLYKLNFFLLYFRLFISILKIYYSINESLIEIGTCLILYKALKNVNSYLCGIYIGICLLAVLLSWIQLVKKGRFQLNLGFQNLYFLIVSNFSIVLYIISIYFIFWGYQEINFLERNDKNPLFANQEKSKFFSSKSNLFYFFSP